MPLQDVVILVSFALAGCGHLLVREVRTAAAVWNWLDGLFPAAWRSAPPVAGLMLLGLGSVGVIAAAVN